MPAAVAIPLITAGVTGAAALGGAAINAKSQKNAANAQADAAQAALDFTKAQKAKQETAAAPYLSLGQMAVGNLPAAVRPTPMGGPPQPYSVAPGMRPSGQETGYSTMSLSGQPPAYGNGPQMPAAPMAAPGAAAESLVTLQAPDGSTRQVPASVAPAYIARGAKQVN